jgi:hypothetical protein
LQTVYLPQPELLQFISIQQSIAAHLGMQLQLLEGMFVLVASAQMQLSRFESQQAWVIGSSSSAVAAAIPWRLRQISSVEVAPNGNPTDATVVLVGGDRVRAGASHDAQLADVPDHEVRVCCCLQCLCMKLAGFQHMRRMPQLCWHVGCLTKEAVLCGAVGCCCPAEPVI